ncbi:MAG: AraC family transcriptional regulator [Bacteroidales bacterium]|jgi:tetratricopeptide (TPR) repeat protein
MKRIVFTTAVILTSYLILHTSFSIATEKVPFTKEQTRTIDSLRQVLKTSVNKGKAKIYNELAEKYIDVSYEAALKYANEALKIAEQTGNISEKANALGILGLTNYRIGNLKAANNYYERALSIYVQKADKKGIAKINANTGSIYITWNNYDEAMKRCKKALQTYKEMKDKPSIAKVLINIGNIYKYKNQYKEAEYYFQESLAILYELGVKKEISMVLNNIGNIYTAWDENETALKYYRRALKIAEELKNKEDISMVLNNIGLIYKKIGKYSEALKNFTRILDIQNELKSKSIISTIYRNIAEVYEKQDDFQKALYYYKKSYDLMDKKSNELVAGLLNNFGNIYKKLGNYNIALQYFKQSISITDSINKFGNLSIKNHKDISDLYEKMNDYKTSNKYLRQYYALNDSVYNKETHQQIVEINTKYETERKDKEIKLLNTQQQLNDAKYKKRVNLFISIVLVFILILVAVVFYNNKIKSDKNLAFKNLEIVKSENEILKSKQIQLINENKLIADTNTIEETSSENDLKPQAEKYSTSPLTDLQKQELANKITEVMERDKLYTDVNLNINDFSKKLNTNRFYISNVINETFNKNFTNFINEYRVKEARRLLSDAESQKYTLETIAKFAGFNSRSVFIDAFKKYTGITPSFYKRTIKIL